eukprot:TRINITY_DN4864_c0_g1_i1.p1 TRINITY_DN4864_c0_g1~~TRINITY_DN4864_c0_g1_i1.p1  ORF type:complete len:792 (+),score=167.24 TRINITY_DN4864_c0_g1_i1:74-2377(+)
MSGWLWFTPILAIAAMITCFLIFCFVRKKYSYFYLPKIHSGEKDAPIDPQGFFSWILYVIAYDDSKLLQKVGLDAILYLYFLKYSTILFFGIAIISNVIILPLNIVNGHSAKATSYLSQMDRYSMANIPNGSQRLWVHLLSVFVFSFGVYFVVYRLYKQWQETFLADNTLKKQDHFQSRTVFVEGLPKYCKSDADLNQLFIRMFGRDRVVHTIMLPYNIWQIQKLQEKRKKKIFKWKRAVDYFKETKGKRLTHRVSLLDAARHSSNSELDDMDTYKKEIAKLEKQIRQLQQEYFSNAETMISSGSGFVTFDCVSTAMMCSQTLLHIETHKLQCKLAPTIEEIDWDWFARSPFEKYARQGSVYTLMVILFITWSIPVTAISAWANLDKLDTTIFHDLVQWVSSIPVIRGVVQGVLPSMALSGFIVILPYLLKLILVPHKYLLHSQYDRGVLRAFWLFLTMNVFMVSILVNSTFGVVSNILQNPNTALTILGESVPKQSLYFANYVIIEGMIGYTLFFMCRLDDVILYQIKTRFLLKTNREKEEAIKPLPFDFPVQYSRELFIFCIGMSYSTMSPLILPFVWMYFFLAYLSARHNFIYVFTPNYGGLRMTRLAINRMIAAVFIFQVAMMGTLGIKGFHFAGLILFLLMGDFFVLFQLRNKFHPSTKFLALHNCAEKREDTQQELQEIEGLYKHPALREPEPLESLVSQERKKSVVQPNGVHQHVNIPLDPDQTDDENEMRFLTDSVSQDTFPMKDMRSRLLGDETDPDD